MSTKDINKLGQVAVIGVGGIGSYFMQLVAKMELNNQLEAESYTLFDDDIVEEKNTRHQNYDSNHIGLSKVVLTQAFCKSVNPNIKLRIKPRRFTAEDLGDYNTIVICADNAQIRKIVHDYVQSNDTVKVLDMRCSGDMYSVYTHKCDYNTILESLGEDPTSEQGFSCQRTADTSVNRINMGNFVVAPVGVQVLMNMRRGEVFPSEMVRRIM